jgi:exoribonuclease-2
MKPILNAAASGGNAPKTVSGSPATDRATLAAIAHQAMITRGLEPDFPLAAQKELAAIGGPAKATNNVRDLRNLLWASIDNDDSRDLDQLTVAESLSGGQVRILVAVADVDALVRKGSALDAHAARNTTSVYTPAAIFPMLPEALSTDLTSLNEDQDRLAIVADMVFKEDGSLITSKLYRAQVHNRAKLAYNSLGAWLTGNGPAPKRIAEVAGLDENLRLQDRVAQRLTGLRHHHGALSLESLEAQAIFSGVALS